MKELENYTEFLNTFQEEKYHNFTQNLSQYNELFTDWMDAMKGSDSEARKDTSLALSKWLSENIDQNP